MKKLLFYLVIILFSFHIAEASLILEPINNDVMILNETHETGNTYLTYIYNFSDGGILALSLAYANDTYGHTELLSLAYANDTQGGNSTFNQSLTDSLYVNVDGDAMSGNLNMSGNDILNIDSISIRQFIIGVFGGALDISGNPWYLSSVNLEVDNNITADHFIGDGSLLTNLPSSGSGNINGTDVNLTKLVISNQAKITESNNDDGSYTYFENGNMWVVLS